MSYRDIMRGAELKAEYDEYIAWKGKTRAQKQTAYASLQVSKFTYNKQVVWVAPFAQTGKNLWVEVEICASGTPSPGSEALSLGGDFFKTAAPAEATDIIISDPRIFPRKKLAKMIVKLRKSTASQNSDSRITGRKYKRHGTDSVSVFLGQNAAGDDFNDVVKAIKAKAAYETFITVTGNTIQFIPEG